MLPMPVAMLEALCLEVQVVNLRYGPGDHPDGTGYAYLREQAEKAARECETAFAAGMGSWRLTLRKEYRSALACTEPDHLRDELLRVAAVAVAWANAIEQRRQGGE
jgi:hypothetical protein